MYLFARTKINDQFYISRDRFGIALNSFWNCCWGHFGVVLDSWRYQFGVTWESLGGHFGVTSAAVTNKNLFGVTGHNFGTTLGSLWNCFQGHCEVIMGPL